MSNAKTIDDKELERLAVEELLREACRGAVRAEAQGPSGWLKCPLPKTNETFLRTTLRNAAASNYYLEKRQQKRLAERRSTERSKRRRN